MSQAIKKRFENPDENREVPKATVEVVNLGQATALIDRLLAAVG